MSSKSPQASQRRLVIDKILNRLAEAEQPLPRSLELYNRILTIQSDTRIPALDDTVARLKKTAGQALEQGKPIVSFSDLPMDWQDAWKLYLAIVEIAAEFLSPTEQELEKLKQSGSSSDLLEQACRDWFEATTMAGQAAGREAAAMTSLMSSVYQATLYPILSPLADRLVPGISKQFWHRS